MLSFVLSKRLPDARSGVLVGTAHGRPFMRDCGPPLIGTKREHSHLSVNRFVDDEEVHDVDRGAADCAYQERARRAAEGKADRGCQGRPAEHHADYPNGATMGEIVDALKKLWGTYREMPVF